MKTSTIRGVPSGVLLVLLGIWVAIVPFVGPVFDYSIGSTDAWNWQTGWLWLNVLPGAAAVLAGLVMIGSFRRMSVGSAGILAAVAGGWIVVAPEVSRVWNDGLPASGAAFGSTDVQVLEMLGYSLLSGLLIALLGAFEIGHNSVRPADEAVAEDFVAVPGAPETAAPRRTGRPMRAPTGTRNRQGVRGDAPSGTR